MSVRERIEAQQHEEARLRQEKADAELRAKQQAQESQPDFVPRTATYTGVVGNVATSSVREREERRLSQATPEVHVSQTPIQGFGLSLREQEDIRKAHADIAAEGRVSGSDNTLSADAQAWHDMEMKWKKRAEDAERQKFLDQQKRDLMEKQQQAEDARLLPIRLMLDSQYATAEERAKILDIAKRYPEKSHENLFATLHELRDIARVNAANPWKF